MRNKVNNVKALVVLMLPGALGKMIRACMQILRIGLDTGAAMVE